MRCGGLVCRYLGLAAVFVTVPMEEQHGSPSTAAVERAGSVFYAEDAPFTSPHFKHEPMPLEDGFPAGIRLLGGMQGAAAIAALGERLSEVEAFHDWTPEKLKQHFRAGPELRVKRSGQPATEQRSHARLCRQQRGGLDWWQTHDHRHLRQRLIAEVWQQRQRPHALATRQHLRQRQCEFRARCEWLHHRRVRLLDHLTQAYDTLPLNERGLNNDFDKDDLNNLFEFAIAGSDPAMPNSFAASLDGLTVSFTKRPGITVLTYAIQDSTDLGQSDPWAGVTGGTYIKNAGVISYVLPTGPAKLFVLLRVTSP